VLIYTFYTYRINDRRRHTYYVSDEDGMEMGKRGTGEFTYREIDPDELEIGDLLGEGAYGKVRLLLLHFEFFTKQPWCRYTRVLSEVLLLV